MSEIEFGDPPEWGKYPGHISVAGPPKTIEEPLNSSISLALQAVWPQDLPKEAYHGLSGEIVDAIEPHTEADPAALLMNLLVAFGNAIGRVAHFKVAGACHYLNLFTNLIGETSKARKGTSWNPVEELFKRVDPEWAGNSISSGLSSGEGLIWAVRDPISQRQPIKEDGRVIDYQEVITDSGIADKRFLVIEEEFGRTLQSIGREGNVLSPVIRQAWDSGNLRALTKTSPAKATGAHISIIGHITKDELLRLFKSNDASNGFANRFLWMVVRRSKCLPEGGGLTDDLFNMLANRLAERLSVAKYCQEIKRDGEAREIWASIYPTLSEGRPGIFGSVTSRAEAQVMRIACVYALMDGSELVNANHLLAALAVWGRAESSVKFIFGDLTGDSVADRILDALLSSKKLSRTEISNLFSKNLPASRIDTALSLLHRSGRAQAFTAHTNGRPEIIWRPTECTK